MGCEIRSERLCYDAARRLTGANGARNASPRHEVPTVTSTAIFRFNVHGGDGAVILPEFKFDAKTPPMFMLHGDKDYYSPMASVQIYTELHRRKIPAQLFVYANVSHGLGNTANARGWQDRIVDWIESIGF